MGENPIRPRDGATRLVLLRHGESVWNRDGRFTGWTDVGLSPRGIEQAEQAGRTLAASGFSFDVCFTSCLSRATETLRILLAVMGQEDAEVRASWQLNERHYGALQGLGRWQAVWKFGPRSVIRCQRDYAAPPPRVEPTDPRFPGLDPRYASLCATQLPRGESIKDTFDRVLPYWREVIAPEIRAGKRVLIVSHRNTLSVLVKILDNVSDRLAPRLKMRTGRPLVYELGPDLTRRERYYLDPAAVVAARSTPGPSTGRET